MNKWPAPKSNTRIALGLTFIIAGFVWAIYFFAFIPFSPSDRLTGWFGAITASILLFLGLCIGFGAKPKEVIVGSLVIVAWSLGLILLPAPEGYTEAVFGSWAILGMIIIIIYAKYEKSRKKNSAQLMKNT
jgi:hypothetical protein